MPTLRQHFYSGISGALTTACITCTPAVVYAQAGDFDGHSATLNEILIFAISAMFVLVWGRIFGLEYQSVKAWLRRSEGYDEYREMLQISPDAALIKSNERFVYANPAALRMFSAPSLGTLVRRRGFEMVHPDFRDAAAATRRRGREYGL